MAEASIVLLTWNGQTYLHDVLQMIHRQKLKPLEILAIDSNSADTTAEILRKFDVPTTTISKTEFSHSATRNMAVRMCSGQYVVFLTQDSVPADSCWLECLLRPFEEIENVAAVFSKQIPRPGASLLEANDLRQDFPAGRRIKSLQAGEKPDPRKVWDLIKFSNSSAAYARQLLLENPFCEQLEMAEDQEWAHRMLHQNQTLIYEPASVVVHSHEHSLKDKYERSLRMGKSFSTFLKSCMRDRSALLEIGACAAHVYLDFSYIVSACAPWKEKLKWLALSPVHRGAIHYAYRKGWNSSTVMPTNLARTARPYQ